MAIPMALIALAVRLESRGPVFFRQKRMGFNHDVIEVFKFRSMCEDASGAKGEIQQATNNDPRITRVGKFLRRWSLDELPQLFNVLRGQMSIVGPRPHAVEHRFDSRKLEEVVDRYAARHKVKPGITGWAQIHGWRGVTDTVEKLQKRVEHDLYYIEHWSLALDAWILLVTPFVLLKGRNAY